MVVLTLGTSCLPAPRGTNANHNGVLDAGAPAGKLLTGIASVRMRLDGFVHIEPTGAPPEPAVLVTRPLVFS
eukprot:SAG22_NODE_17211_length_309_cov_0.971429_1_plen_71_part_10